MRRIHCQNCGATGVEGSVCAYCGNRLVAPVIQDAGVDGPSGEKGIGKTIMLVETLSSREGVEKEVSESFAFMWKSYRQYIGFGPDAVIQDPGNWVAPLPYDINLDSFNMGALRKVYLPFYFFRGKYDGIWVDRNNKSGNYFGAYTLLTPAFIPSDKSYISNSSIRRICLVEEDAIRESRLSDLRKTGEEIHPVTSQPDIAKLTPQIDELRKELSQTDARMILDEDIFSEETSLKSAQAKFYEEKTGIAYVSYWVLPIIISGIKKEYLFGQHHLRRCSNISSLTLGNPLPNESNIDYWFDYCSAAIGTVNREVSNFMGVFIMGKEYWRWCRPYEADGLKKYLLNNKTKHMDESTLKNYRKRLAVLVGEEEAEEWFGWFESERKKNLKPDSVEAPVSMWSQIKNWWRNL